MAASDMAHRRVLSVDSVAGTIAIVTGASRGFGRAVSAALCDPDDGRFATRLIAEYRPRTLVLCAVPSRPSVSSRPTPCRESTSTPS